MRIEKIKFMLMAQDMDRAVAFYRDVIGLEPGYVSPHWSELRFGDAIVALHGGGSGHFHETGLSFQVEDLDAAVAEVTAGGGTIRNPPESRPGEPIRLVELTDPEGNGFMLSQYLG
jgi:predicted enzyme related to lactoylglutathione lyase